MYKIKKKQSETAAKLHRWTEVGLAVLPGVRSVGRLWAEGCHPPVDTPLLLASLHLDGLKVNAGVDGVQLAVQGMKGGSLGGLGGPAAHHHAVDVLRAAGRTRQPEPGRKQLQYLLVAFSCRQKGK